MVAPWAPAGPKGGIIICFLFILRCSSLPIALGAAPTWFPLTALAHGRADGLGDLGLVLRLPVMEEPKGRRREARVAGEPRTSETSV